jgi:glycosyltransferase involved in cell wall biosynthesis
LRVTFYHRCPQGTHFSIERLFADVRRALPQGIRARVAVSRFPSRGFWGRVYNIVEAAFHQGDINHITGDVHFLALLLRKKRTLLTVHDLVSVHRLKGWRRAIFIAFWYWLPIERAAVVSVISEFTKNDLLRHINVDPRRVRVVYDCVSDAFLPAARDFNAVTPVVLQIGTGANKNLARVAQALQGIPCQLRVIGNLDKAHLTLLRQCDVAYSSVSHISDAQVIDAYRECDMLVFASTYEGFGLPIVEAQATGRPVITSTVCSMPEVAGDAACMVDPFDVASIREGILKVITDRAYRDTLVRRGFENVKRFRPERIAQQYVDIYMDMLREQQASHDRT